MKSTSLHRAGNIDVRRVALLITLVAIVLALSCFRGAGVAPDDFGSSAAPGEAGAAGAAPRRILMTQIPAGALADEASPEGGPGQGRLPDGARIVVFDSAQSRQGTDNLTPGFSAAGRPEVSFDGERILFVARRAPGDPTGVWEMRLDGTGVREIVRPEGDCEAGVYLSTIFTLDAERPLHQIGFAMNDPAVDHSSLYTSHLDGSNVRQITFAPHGVSDPLLLSDGRLLFSMASDARTPPSSTWFTVNTDGTDVFPFAGQHEPRVLRSDPCETDEGDVVYVESGSARDEGGGLLAAVSRTRSLTTRRALAVESGWTYRSPSPLPNGHLLVSYRPEGDGPGDSFGLYELDPVRGRRVALIYDDPEWHEIDAVVVRPRAEPPGRSTVVSDGGEAGQLNCLDAYVSDRPEGQDLERGSIARVRVITAGPGHSPEAVTLGEADVESDGSFFLEIPARTPLRLETLDGSGEVLQAMKSWMWVMPIERRGCIGCHEDREMAPPNRHVLALRKPPQVIGGDGDHSSKEPR